MNSFNKEPICKAKIVVLAIIVILWPSFTMAQESDGLLQKAYKKFVLKGKSAEAKPPSKPENTGAPSGISGETAGTTNYDEAYKNMSKAEMIQNIKNEIDSEGEILKQMSDLKKQNGKDGKEIYLYMIDGKQVNLEDVDEKTVRDIIKQVMSKSAQLRNEAIMEQQDMLRRIRDEDAAAQSSERPSRPPSAPEMVSQPPRAPEMVSQPPRAPAGSSQPPRAPAGPPSLPRR